MKEMDPRVDAYIEKAAPFAKPILLKIEKTDLPGLSGCKRNH